MRSMVEGAGRTCAGQILPGTGMSRHAMPPAWLRVSGGHPHLLMTMRSMVEGVRHPRFAAPKSTRPAAPGAT